MKKQNLTIVFILAVFLIFMGCESIERTSLFYQPVSSVIYPPKAKNTVIPIISKGSTRRTYKVIGEMEFESTRSEKFILDAIQYNGRQNGADAIILEEWVSEKKTYVEVEPHWLGLSWHHYRACDTGFGWSVNSFPRVQTYTHHFKKVKATMIVFMDHDTFGYSGFLLEDVRNAEFLEIGEILPGSPADQAGLQKGDWIYKINDYQCNKGLEHYQKEGPIFHVGKDYVIEYERNGLKNTVTITAQKMKS